nr:MAG TPA: hypothetical protein [Caudoviricetes sp.]
MLQYFDSSYYVNEIDTPSLEVWSYDKKYKTWDLEGLYFEIDGEYVEQDIDEYFGMLVYPDNELFVGIEITEKEFNKLINQ